ncbi:MAG TPA: hypothetical protein VFS20_29675 [Longimicrobium sp.]|nr:hypothetical protein [Longimicrobium sp.]
MRIDRQEIPSIVSRTGLAAGHVAGACDDLLDTLGEHRAWGMAPLAGSRAVEG